MDPVKVSPSPSVSSTDASKRAAQPKEPEKSQSDPDVVAAKKAAEPPRPTTNTQGQALGQRLNVTA